MTEQHPRVPPLETAAAHSFYSAPILPSGAPIIMSMESALSMAKEANGFLSVTRQHVDDADRISLPPVPDGYSEYQNGTGWVRK